MGGWGRWTPHQSLQGRCQFHVDAGPLTRPEQHTLVSLVLHPLMRSGDCPSWDLGSNHHRLGWWGSETVTPSAKGAGGAAREEIVVWVEILTSDAALASAFSSWKASWAPWFPPACSLHKELEACCHISPGRSWNRSRMQPRLSKPGD